MNESLPTRIPTRAPAEEANENLASIERIPLALLPKDDLARSALILLAAAGHDCYAYASGGELTGTWCVWLGDLARVRADRNGRVPVTEWSVFWRDLMAEMRPAIMGEVRSHERA